MRHVNTHNTIIYRYTLNAFRLKVNNLTNFGSQSLSSIYDYDEQFGMSNICLYLASFELQALQKEKVISRCSAHFLCSFRHLSSR